MEKKIDAPEVVTVLKGTVVPSRPVASKLTCKVCKGNHPTYQCCDRCNYDLHRCPGCGADLPHDEDVCEECEAL